MKRESIEISIKDPEFFFPMCSFKKINSHTPQQWELNYCWFLFRSNIYRIFSSCIVMERFSLTYLSFESYLTLMIIFYRIDTEDIWKWKYTEMKREKMKNWSSKMGESWNLTKILLSKKKWNVDNCHKNFPQILLISDIWYMENLLIGHLILQNLITLSPNYCCKYRYA